MRSLFLRLYLLLILVILGFGWSIDQVIDSYSPAHGLTTNEELHQGTFFLLTRELKRLPPEERPGYLASIAPSFGFALALLPESQLPLTSEQLELVREGYIVEDFHDLEGESWLFQKLAGSSNVMQLGPIYNEPMAQSSTVMTGALFLLLAMSVFIWAWPLAKGLRELTQAALAFGTGDFSARAKVSPTAPLSELVNRFNAMAARIQRLLESHKELSHAVSHELRTPIARLRFAMAMVREVDESQVRDKYLDKMEANIQELDGLVDELLTYARFDREEPELKFKQLDICDFVRRFTREYQQTESNLGIEYIPNPKHAELRLGFDTDALHRVLDNLTRNAVRYARNRINLGVVLSSETVTVYVEDDGPGVPMESRSKLFDPFVRLDESRDRTSGGIGLGLAIVKRLIELHHGRVELVDSDMGGARFLLHLPLTPQE